MRALFAAIALFVWIGVATKADALLCTPILGCTCNVTATDLDFDAFNPLSGAQDAVAEVSVDCTGVIDVAPSVVTTLTAGTHGTISARRMRAGVGEYLDYNIYTTDQRTTVWGNGTTGSSVSISGGLLSLGHWQAQRDMFGRAVPLTSTKVGHYEDTVVVRIVW